MGLFGNSGAGGPLAQAVAPKPKINWLGVLADALSGAAGQTPLYTQSLLKQREDDREDRRYQLRQNAAIEAQKAFYLWKQEHPNTPAPTEYERALAAAGIQPGTPKYVEHMKNLVQMKENPVWTYTDPTTGAIMMGSKGPVQPEILPSLPPGAKPIGGPTPSASGGFPSGHK